MCLLQTMVTVKHLHSENQSTAGKKGNKDNNGSQEKNGKVPITSGRTGSFPLAVFVEQDLLACESDTPGAGVVQKPFK